LNATARTLAVVFSRRVSGSGCTASAFVKWLACKFAVGIGLSHTGSAPHSEIKPSAGSAGESTVGSAGMTTPSISSTPLENHGRAKYTRRPLPTRLLVLPWSLDCHLDVGTM